MLIVEVINNFNRGGAETLLLNICRGVKEQNQNIKFHILLLEDNLQLAEEFTEAGITWEILPLESTNFFHQTSIITERLKELKPDIVHSHLMRSDRVSLLAGLLAGVKRRYSTIHNMEPQKNRYDVFARLMAAIFSTKLIAVSHSAKQFCRDRKLYPIHKINVIPNAPGIHPGKQQIRATRHSDRKHKFINIARLHEQKGQVYLIEAMRIVRDKGLNLSLSIYGTGGLEDELQNLIDQFNLQNMVKLEGLTTEIVEKMKEADYSVSSSLWEGLPLSQVEAAMMGLPLVLTDIAPHREIIDSLLPDTYPIPYAKPYNPDSLANAIIAAIESDNFTYSKASKLSLKLAENYSFKSMIDNYIKLYT